MQSGKLIQKAGRRLQRLLENFVIYSQIEVFASDPARLAAFRKSQLPQTADLIGPLSRTKAESWGRLADLAVDLTAGPVAIAESYLTKICEELLDNAFKFSVAGTQVMVRTYCDRDDFVLSIADSGRGMTSEQVANLGAYVQFERKFYEQQGTGLGLVIAKRLTEMHGGRMELDMSCGQGLTVRVHLPVPSTEK